MFLTSPNLAGVSHGFFTRRGGVSKGIYASLNCGLGSGDDLAHVIENRERVARALGGEGTKLLSLHQVHGCDAVTVHAPWRHAKKPKADAMVTAVPGLALGVLAADCVPVLFADKEHRIVAAVHSGWKGTIAGISERTIEAMCALGAKREGIHAAIGPCIGYASYEVDAGRREDIINGDRDLMPFFRPSGKTGHFLFDIRSSVGYRLAKAGLTDINTLENDTYIEEDDFFSFRRTTHTGEPDYGRQVSAIMITP